MADFPPDTILELPSHITATYLSEGAANVVYTINVPPQSSTDEHGDGQENGKASTPNPWHGKLLRFRKDLPTTTPTLTAHLAFRTSIAPLFPSEDLIDIRLVSLGSSHLIRTLNAALVAAEKASSSTPRPKQRHGVYLADDPHALLITDMSPPTSASLIQFKPKWLAPSPSAPPGSKRCRTCALHARRAIKKPSFCPLDLISSHPPDVRRAAALLLGLPASAAESEIATSENGNGNATSKTATAPTATPTQLATLTRLTHWALTSPLLRHLRHLQSSCDPLGVLSVIESGDAAARRGLQIAMTLRDVTVFLVVPDGEGVLRARLGDLDVKSLGKVGEWGEVERGLGGGWYQGNGGEEGVCWLGREWEGENGGEERREEKEEKKEVKEEKREVKGERRAEKREVKREVKKASRMGGCIGQ